MSKNIIIQNNGTSVTYTGVDKIKTRKASKGTLYWLPEDEVLRGTINITENGTYKAEAASVYAFSQAVVNVPAKPTHVSGKGQDGNMYDVTIDPETGEITQTEIPAGIMITVPPLKIAYVDGETIDYTGMVVKWVDGQGEPFECDGYPGGVIPSNEWILTEHTAHYDGGGGGSGTSIDISPFAEPIDTSSTAWVHASTRGGGRWDTEYTIEESADVVFFITAVFPSVAWTGYKSVIVAKAAANIESKPNYSKYTYDDQDVYFRFLGSTSQSNVDEIEQAPNIGEFASTPDIQEYIQKIAWNLLHGGGGTSTQTIPVSVLSPFDSKQYTDTFEIQVEVGSTESGSAH